MDVADCPCAMAEAQGILMARIPLQMEDLQQQHYTTELHV
jgi:hypothetical protein